MTEKKAMVDDADFEVLRQLLHREGDELPIKDNNKIEDILASCSPEDLATTDEDRGWMNMLAVGKEII